MARENLEGGEQHPLTELTGEQKRLMLQITGYFGDPNGHMLDIPTHAKHFERSTPQARDEKDVPLLDDTGEALIWRAKDAGIIEEVMDHRLPDSAGDSGNIHVPGNPDAGITIIFTQAAVEWFIANQGHEAEQGIL